jgi:hypothetical protein
MEGRDMAKEQKTNNGANLGFEAKLFLTADKLRGSMDASEYKHVAFRQGYGHTRHAAGLDLDTRKT